MWDACAYGFEDGVTSLGIVSSSEGNHRKKSDNDDGEKVLEEFVCFGMCAFTARPSVSSAMKT